MKERTKKAVNSLYGQFGQNSNFAKEQKISEQKGTIDLLRKEIDSLVKSNNDKARKILSLERLQNDDCLHCEIIRSLNVSIESQQDSISKLSNDNKLLRHRISEQDKLLDKDYGGKIRMEQLAEISDLKIKLEVAVKENIRLSQERAIYKHDCDSLKARNHNLIKQVGKLQEEHRNNMHIGCDIRTMYPTVMFQRSGKSLIELAQLEIRKSKMEDDYSKLSQENAVLRKELEYFKTSYNDLSKNAWDLQQKLFLEKAKNIDRILRG